jgi:hypothetical protein
MRCTSTPVLVASSATLSRCCSRSRWIVSPEAQQLGVVAHGVLLVVGRRELCARLTKPFFKKLYVMTEWDDGKTMVWISGVELTESRTRCCSPRGYSRPPRRRPEPSLPVRSRKTGPGTLLTSALPALFRSTNKWRRGRDSNPRDRVCPPNSFQGCRIQPLCHPSRRHRARLVDQRSTVCPSQPAVLMIGRHPCRPPGATPARSGRPSTTASRPQPPCLFAPASCVVLVEQGGCLGLATGQ